MLGLDIKFGSQLFLEHTLHKFHEWYCPDTPSNLYACKVALYIKSGYLNCKYISRDHHSGYGLNQWEMTLPCNAASHWLSTYPEWTLIYLIDRNNMALSWMIVRCHCKLHCHWLIDMWQHHVSLVRQTHGNINRENGTISKHQWEICNKSFATFLMKLKKNLYNNMI